MMYVVEFLLDGKSDACIIEAKTREEAKAKVIEVFKGAHILSVNIYYAAPIQKTV